MKTTSDDAALLDRDDTDRFGPETITLKKVDADKKYRCYVHNYSNRLKKRSETLSESKAMVKVYAKNRLRYVFQVPRDKKGTLWRLFSIEKGEIVVEDKVVVK